VAFSGTTETYLRLRGTQVPGGASVWLFTQHTNRYPKEPIIMIHTAATTTLSDVVRGTAADRSHLNVTGRIPGVVNAARAILVVQGLIVLALGVYLVQHPDPLIPAWLGIGSIVEGSLRIALGAALRRSRAVRMAAIVLCSLSAVVGFMAGGVYIVGGLVGVAVVRCLTHDNAKAHFGI
jgi:hypothetical protein